MTEDVGENNSKAWVIKDAPKGSVDIIAVLEDVLIRIRYASTPETAKMASETVLVEHWGTFISICNVGFADVGIGGASFV
jgi:hypothetical protein